MSASASGMIAAAPAPWTARAAISQPTSVRRSLRRRNPRRRLHERRRLRDDRRLQRRVHDRDDRRGCALARRSRRGDRAGRTSRSSRHGRTRAERMTPAPVPVVHLELHTADQVRASEFYARLLHWRSERSFRDPDGHHWDVFWIGPPNGEADVTPECGRRRRHRRGRPETPHKFKRRLRPARHQLHPRLSADDHRLVRELSRPELADDDPQRTS